MEGPRAGGSGAAGREARGGSFAGPASPEPGGASVDARIKASKLKVHQPPEGTGGLTGMFHVYTYDVFHQSFLPGRAFDTVEKAASFQRHEQERIYAEQEADPELFDLPFLSNDPDLPTRVERDPAYRERLIRELGSEARARARKR
jgi:hypothetical protein